MEDIDFTHFHFFVEIFHFFLRLQAVAKEFIISNAGWTVGSVVQLSLSHLLQNFPQTFLKTLFFQCGPFSAVFIEFVKVLLLFYVFWFFGYEAYEILAARAGIEPTPSALEDHWTTREFPSQTLKYFFSFFRLHSTSEGDSAPCLQR